MALLCLTENAYLLVVFNIGIHVVEDISVLTLILFGVVLGVNSEVPVSFFAIGELLCPDVIFVFATGRSCVLELYFFPSIVVL